MVCFRDWKTSSGEARLLSCLRTRVVEAFTNYQLCSGSLVDRDTRDSLYLIDDWLDIYFW